jgi:hypothetical protein
VEIEVHSCEQPSAALLVQEEHRDPRRRRHYGRA